MDGGMNMAAVGTKGLNPWRIIGWGMVAALLLAPLIAMQFTSEVDWDETDFIAMGFILGSLGLALEFMVSRSDSIAYRIASGIAVLAAFLLIWANLAVGMIGSEKNPYNLLFGGVLAIAVVGSIASRFRSGVWRLPPRRRALLRSRLRPAAFRRTRAAPSSARSWAACGFWLRCCSASPGKGQPESDCGLGQKGRAPGSLPGPFRSPS
jgi:hypothetical protein